MLVELECPLSFQNDINISCKPSHFWAEIYLILCIQKMIFHNCSHVTAKWTLYFPLKVAIYEF